MSTTTSPTVHRTVYIGLVRDPDALYAFDCYSRFDCFGVPHGGLTKWSVGPANEIADAAEWLGEDEHQDSFELIYGTVLCFLEEGEQPAKERLDRDDIAIWAEDEPIHRSRVSTFETCGYCGEEVPDTDGWVGGDGYFICSDCDAEVNGDDDDDEPTGPVEVTVVNYRLQGDRVHFLGVFDHGAKVWFSATDEATEADLVDQVGRYRHLKPIAKVTPGQYVNHPFVD